MLAKIFSSNPYYVYASTTHHTDFSMFKLNWKYLKTNCLCFGGSGPDRTAVTRINIFFITFSEKQVFTKLWHNLHFTHH